MSMDYLVIAGKQKYALDKFRTPQQAYAYVKEQAQAWRNAGCNPPEYHVYYHGFDCVEVDEHGVAITKPEGQSC